MQHPDPEDETPTHSEDWKDCYLELQKRYPNSYISPPVRLASQMKAEDLGPDTFGTSIRYEKIREFLKAHQPLGRLVDIGGNCGFFALSLLDEGLIREAIVYDVEPDVLAFGEKMAAELGLGTSCRFVNKPISLDTLDELPSGDVIICQYLIHHAGKMFDRSLVNDLGWELYAQRFLAKLREKFSLGVIGNAYKTGKPAHWDVAQCQRPAKFRALLETTGWRIQFHKCVYEMITGRESVVDLTSRESSPVRHMLLSAAWRLGGRRAESRLRSLLFWRTIDKMERYFLYLTEGSLEKAHVENPDSRTPAG